MGAAIVEFKEETQDEGWVVYPSHHLGRHATTQIRPREVARGRQ
jgi:hypothetical protein